MRKISLILTAFFAIGMQYSYAFETTVSDAACRVEGFARPLRQTIVILDAAAVVPFESGKASEVNRRLNRTVLAISGVLDGQGVVLSAPRERVTLFVAHEDGSDLIRAFTGCPPVYSQEEIERLEKSTGGMMGQFKKFVGRDARSNIEKEKEGFQSALLQTMVEVSKIARGKPTGGTSSSELGFLQAFSFLRGNIDLAHGVPRVIVISPMDVPIIRSMSDSKSARERGFEIANSLGADLQRSEVYLVGVSREVPAHTRDFAHAFFLGIKGRLAATAGEALPPMTEAPQSVHVYGGFIDYIGQKVPVQIRMALDKSGILVNSWIEVTVLRSVATPLTGKAFCKDQSGDSCRVQGDGKEFSQSWVADVRPSPTFNEKLPFSGVRYFEFTNTPSDVKGRVYDPNVVMSGTKSTPFSLPFELSTTSNLRF